MYTVLSVSSDTGLLLQRNDALAMHGVRVLSPRTPEEAPTLAREQVVDAVVMSHSLEPPDRAELIKAVREFCPTCLIAFVFAAPETRSEPLADVSLDVTDGAEPLVKALQERLPRSD